MFYTTHILPQFKSICIVIIYKYKLVLGLVFLPDSLLCPVPDMHLSIHSISVPQIYRSICFLHHGRDIGNSDQMRKFPRALDHILSQQ